MKYLPLPEFDAVTNALNFSTPDCHVIGGCDVYTTKAAGNDKKLYKDIEHSLESQYESLVRLSASLSPPYIPASSSSDDNGDGTTNKAKESSPQQQAAAAKRQKRTRALTPEIDLSRASPFGPLSQITARRTFAYLIATLNASHPDYDFSHLLRPADFRRERTLRAIMHHVDAAMQNLRPRPATLYLAPPAYPSHKHYTAAAPVADRLGGDEVWGPRMWGVIDREMGLRQCERYAYVPEEDPFDGEEGTGPAIWSMHFFFFNKGRKRVCYLHLRGLSVISHSPVHAPIGPGVRGERKVGQGKGGRSVSSVGEGAGKRASYWLGDCWGGGVETGGYGEEDYDDDDYYDDDGGEGGVVVTEPDDDEVEVPHMDLDDIRSDLAEGNYTYDNAEEDEYEDAAAGGCWKPAAAVVARQVRGVSEEVGEAMEI